MKKLAWFLCLLILVFGRNRSVGQVNVTTWHNDNWRTGQNTSEMALNTSSFQKNGFGLLCRISLPSGPPQEQVYAQPLVVSNQDGSTTVYVATMQDNLYMLKVPKTWNTNAGCSQVQSKEISLLPNGQYPADACFIGNGVPQDQNDCSQRVICPSVGVLGTPAIDTGSNTLYLVSETQDNSTPPEGQNCHGKGQPGNFHHYLHALDLTTLAEKNSGPVPISVANPQGQATFNSKQLLQRPGLLFLGPGISPTSPTVYMGFSMMDGTRPNPNGWVLAYDGQNLGQGGFPLAFATVQTPDINKNNSFGGGLWCGGCGLAAGLDGNGNNYIYVSTADGLFDASKSDYGDSFLKLTTALGLASSFTPSDYANRWNNDLDLGSAGTMLVPDGLLNPPYDHIAIKGEKEPNLWVLDRNNPSAVLQQFAAPNSTKQAMTTPAFWFDGTTPFMYFAQQQEQIYQYKLNCNPICSPASASTSIDVTGWKMGYAATPSVSSNGTTSGTGILWALKGHSPTGTLGLYAFDAENLHTLYQPSTCLMRDKITPSKFSVPTVANGYVFVGAETDIDIFGANPGICN